MLIQILLGLYLASRGSRPQESLNMNYVYMKYTRMWAGTAPNRFYLEVLVRFIGWCHERNAMFRMPTGERRQQESHSSENFEGNVK
jgi:hypothetical protein